MELLKMHRLLKEEGVILSFSGTISQMIVSSVAEALERELSASGTDKRVIQHAFAVITEQMQNVMSYSQGRVHRGLNSFESLGLTIAGFDRHKEKYYISSMNRLDISDRPRLIERLEFINTLDEKELREYYKKQRRSGEDKHQHGAGLGFIQMARNASEKLVYNIEELEEKSFFEIKVYL